MSKYIKRPRNSQSFHNNSTFQSIMEKDSKNLQQQLDLYQGKLEAYRKKNHNLNISLNTFQKEVSLNKQKYEQKKKENAGSKNKRATSEIVSKKS